MLKGFFPLAALTGLLALSGLREVFLDGNRVYLLEFWALAVAIVYLAGSFRVSKDLEKRVLPFGLLLIWAAVSAALQMDVRFDSSSFLRYSVRLLFNFFLIWLVAALLLVQQRITVIRKAAALTSIVLAVCFFWDLATDGVRSRYAGGFVDPNYFSSFLILIFFLLVAGAVDQRLSLTRRCVYLGLTGLTLAQALMSYSRAGILVILLGLLLFVLGLAHLKRWRAALGLTMILIFGGAGLVTAVQSEALPDTLQQQWMRWGYQRLTLETSRWVLLRLGIEYIGENPVLGLGAGQSKNLLGRVTGDLPESNVAHNTLLEVGLAGGIPMLVIFLLTVGRWIVLALLRSLSAVWTGWRYRESSEPLCWLAVACTIFSFCLMAMSLDLLTARHSGVFAGICLALPWFRTEPVVRYVAVPYVRG